MLRREASRLYGYGEVSTRWLRREASRLYGYGEVSTRWLRREASRLYGLEQEIKPFFKQRN